MFQVTGVSSCSPALAEAHYPLTQVLMALYLAKQSFLAIALFIACLVWFAGQLVVCMRIVVLIIYLQIMQLLVHVFLFSSD